MKPKEISLKTLPKGYYYVHRNNLEAELPSPDYVKEWTIVKVMADDQDLGWGKHINKSGNNE